MDRQQVMITAGHPTDRELAAIIAALAAHPPAADMAAPRQQSAWVRAARLESCGHQPIDDPIRLLSY
jgi:hypothetical protein